MSAERFAASLTPEAVLRWSQEILEAGDQVGGDWEALHGDEDAMRFQVLTAIAIGRLKDADAQLAAIYAIGTADLQVPEVDGMTDTDRRQRTRVAGVRLFPHELDQLKTVAANEGISIGEVIRRALKGTRAI